MQPDGNPEIPGSHIRGGRDWDIPEDTGNTPDPRGFSTLRVECQSCKFPYEVHAAPWSPLWAKSRCPKCEYVFEVRTRESTMDKIHEEAMYQEDVRHQKAHPKAFSAFSRTRPATSSREVQTKLGPAILIGD